MDRKFAREMFIRLWRSLQDLDGEREQVNAEWMAERHEAHRAAFRMAHGEEIEAKIAWDPENYWGWGSKKPPKGKTTAVKVDAELVRSLTELSDRLAEEAYGRYVAWRDATEAVLREMAPACLPLEEWDAWHTAHRVSEVDYNSQGFGAKQYAEAAAEDRADTYRWAGLPVRIVPGRVISTLDPKKSWADFSVVVLASPMECEIAKRLPGPTMAEWVALCWGRGVNPRVYNPYLPWGFEEKHGIDYSGCIRGRKVTGPGWDREKQ